MTETWTLDDIEKLQQLARVGYGSEPETCARMLAALDQAKERLVVPVIFRSVSPERLIAHREGEPEREFGFDAGGWLSCAFTVAWLAIEYGSVTLRDFSMPEDRNPEDQIRRTLRGACVRWSRDADLPELVSVFESIVVKDDRAIYGRRAGHPTIRTGL